MTIYEAMWSAAAVMAFLTGGFAVGAGFGAAIYMAERWAAKRPAWRDGLVIVAALIALAFASFTAAFYAGGA